MTTLPSNFLGLDSRHSRYERARYAVLPVPYDATTSFQTGTRNGPAAIIEASQQVELFDDELEAESYTAGVATLEALMPNMAGPKQMHEDVFAAARRVVRDGKFLLSLGGEHGISSGLVRAVRERHKKLSLLQIDAHLDLRDEYEGTPFSHASVMRRVMDMGVDVVAAGIRNISMEEHAFCKRKKIEPITARRCHQDDDWIDDVLNRLGETVYISVDIDGFDPAYAPGTGTPEPGGLDWYQVTGLLRLVAAEKKVVAADIVEVLPIPGQKVTEFLAARLAYKLIGYTQPERLSSGRKAR